MSRFAGRSVNVSLEPIYNNLPALYATLGCVVVVVVFFYFLSFACVVVDARLFWIVNVLVNVRLPGCFLCLAV